MTNLDEYYDKSAYLVVERLKQTEWGRSYRGKMILSAYRHGELRVIVPHKIVINGHEYYSFENSILNSSASGMLEKSQGMYRIYIGLYHVSELKHKNVRLLRYADYVIPEDEFIHILIDELLSRYQLGTFFINGEASHQEELDAWEAAEEAVKAYYDDENYKVNGLSSSPPKYGPDNPYYIQVR
jgi:hypothetical protein